MTPFKACVLPFVACLAMPLLAHAAPASDGPAAPSVMRQLIERRSENLVTVKFVMKGDDESMGGDQEMEVTGIMLDAKGLVLVSNTEMGGMMARLGMGGGGPQPSDIKVLVAEDTQGAEAKLIARDSELDFAWVRIDKAPEKPYAFLDLSKHADVNVGDYLYSLNRMGKYFDRAANVSEFRLSGSTKKPRELLLGGTLGLFGGLGMPVFSSEGELVGVSTLILPNKDEMEGAASGGMNGMRDMMTGAIIPAKEVAEATKRALEAAPAPEAAAAETPKESK